MYKLIDHTLAFGAETPLTDKKRQGTRKNNMLAETCFKM